MNTQQDAEHRTPDRWHVGKEIPLAMIFTIALQTMGFIWWIATFSATVTAKLDEVSNQVAALTIDRYSQHDAARDIALLNEKINNLREEMKWRKSKQ